MTFLVPPIIVPHIHHGLRVMPGWLFYPMMTVLLGMLVILFIDIFRK